VSSGLRDGNVSPRHLFITTAAHQPKAMLRLGGGSAGQSKTSGTGPANTQLVRTLTLRQAQTVVSGAGSCCGTWLLNLFALQRLIDPSLA